MVQKRTRSDLPSRLTTPSLTACVRTRRSLTIILQAMLLQGSSRSSSKNCIESPLDIVSDKEDDATVAKVEGRTTHSTLNETRYDLLYLPYFT